MTFEPVDLRQALVVIGFPSVGLVGSLATAHLIASLGLRHVGAVLSPTLPPMAVVRDGVGASPIRVYLGDVVCGPDGECDQLCVIHSDIVPRPSAVAALAEALVVWARSHRASQVVSLDGVRAESPAGDGGRVYGLGSSPEALRVLGRLGLPASRDGVLAGVGGVVLATARALGQRALCILAETREGIPDARGAAGLLSVLGALVPLVDIDEAPLREQAQALEAAFREQEKRSAEAVEALSQAKDIMFG